MRDALCGICAYLCRAYYGVVLRFVVTDESTGARLATRTPTTCVRGHHHPHNPVSISNPTLGIGASETDRDCSAAIGTVATTGVVATGIGTVAITGVVATGIVARERTRASASQNESTD